MKTITLRLDDALHKELKLKMAIDDTSMQEFIVNLIKKELKKK